jgi:ribosomal protein S18 acetylase RimI-like enzyme
MSSPVVVRPATLGDGAALLEVDHATWSPAWSPGVPPDRDRDPTFFRPQHGGPEGFLVAVLAGELVGYVALHPAGTLPSHAHVRIIDGLGVLPAVQRRGVGRALVEAAVTRARDEGAAKVTLRVLSTNPAARRLYERCGFVVEGVLVGEFVVDGSPVDDVWMARHLR